MANALTPISLFAADTPRRLIEDFVDIGVRQRSGAHLKPVINRCVKQVDDRVGGRVLPKVALLHSSPEIRNCHLPPRQGPSIAQSKAAPHQATRASALRPFRGICGPSSASEHDVRVNVVAPGAANTAMIDRFTGSDEVKEQLINRVLLKRLATPEEVANTVVFIAADQASFITGASLPVDGSELAQ